MGLGYLMAPKKKKLVKSRHTWLGVGLGLGLGLGLAEEEEVGEEPPRLRRATGWCFRPDGPDRTV